MLYSSFTYLFLFLPVAVAGFLFVPRRWAFPWLLGASWIFYAWWDWRFLPLLLLSIVFNWWAADHSRIRLAVAVNLLILGVFKYLDFFLDSVGKSSLGIPLPVGISFFIFQQIAFVVDHGRGLRFPCSPRDYALTVSLFCQLVSGPIVYVQQIVPQFARACRIDWDNIARGLTLISLGLAKKAVADQFAAWSYIPGLSETTASFTGAWFTGLSYALRIYFDFSAYIDLARGSGYLINLEMPVNFNSPYKALNFRDFWRRWNITLSDFLRDYLYVPLGGNRHHLPRTIFNLMATMLLAGLWHGAGWGFILWGGLWGVCVCLNHLWDRAGLRAPRWLARAVTFLVAVMAWSFFKSPTLSEALNLFRALVGLNGLEIALPLRAYTWYASSPLHAYLGGFVRHSGSLAGFFGTIPALWVLGGLAVAWWAPNSDQISRGRMTWWRALWLAAAFVFGALSIFGARDFVYFQF